MKGVRFEFLELRYGRHDGRVEFGDGGRPYVILGPNGAGKSTLVEAIVRALYGFRRVRKEDRLAHDRRRPWSGGPYRAILGLRGLEGRLTIERDFETDDVEVRLEGRDAPVFEGEANPSRSGEAIRRYRALLRRHVGLPELDAYERTACVHQGDLMGTALGEDLLRVAAGGHADVETARERLLEEHHELTVEPIAEGETRRRKPGEVERCRERLADLEARAREARAAEARRAPLVRSRDELRAEAGAVGEEIERLEAAIERVSEVERWSAAADASRERVRQLEAVGYELDEALARLELLRDRSPGDAPPAYPDDFLERAGALEDGLWPRRRGLEAERDALRRSLEETPEPGTPWSVAAGGLAIAAGVAVAALGPTFPGALLMAIGGAVGATALHRRRSVRVERRRVERELERVAREAREVERRIAARLEGVPQSGTLGPETLPDRRREFERQREQRKLLEDAEGALRAAMDRAGRALREAEARDAGGERAADGNGGAEARRGTPEPPGGPGGLVDRTRGLLTGLHAAASREREDRLAPLKVRLLEASRSSFGLPEGVEASADAVRKALRSRRERAAELREELETIQRRIAFEGRPSESAVGVEEEAARERERLRRLERRVAAFRRAYAFLTEAYESFRRTDQERLLEAISGHLLALSGGGLGPLEAEGDLEAAVVRAGSRSLPMGSPPLSYGQLHTALLAVRLGATDFLAGLGVRLPLLVDDPFVHLDERRAADLWEVLASVAERRQVILATQDRLLLDHLGVRADLQLEDVPTAVRAGTRTDADEDPGGEEGGGTMEGAEEEAVTEGRGAAGEADGTREAESRESPGGADRELDLWSAVGEE